MSAIAVINLCIWKDFHFGLLKLVEGNFQQDIKLQGNSLTFGTGVQFF